MADPAAEPQVFRPSSAALAVAVVAFPALAAVFVLLGTVAVLLLRPTLGLPLFVLLQLLALVPAGLLVLIMRYRFTLEVGPAGLTVGGGLGTQPLRLRWEDLDAVGLVEVRGSRLLAVRPVQGWRQSPHWPLRWDASRGVLTIAGLDNWSAPRDELLATIRRYAGMKWVDELDRVG